MATIAEKPQSISEARKAAGLSQQALAELVGCSVAYVRLIEHGYTAVDPARATVQQRVLRVLRALNDERRPGRSGVVSNLAEVGSEHEPA